MNGLPIQIWTFVKPLLVPCFLIFPGGRTKRQCQTLSLLLPFVDLCTHIFLLPLLLEGQSATQNGCVDVGVWELFQGHQLVYSGTPYPTNNPLEHWVPLSVKHHLGGLPRVQPQVAVAMCCCCCHCRRRMWKDTGDSSQSDICWFLTGQNPFTLMLMTVVSFHLGFYYCLFSVLCFAGSTGGVSPRMGIWLCRNVTVAR